MQAKSRHFEIRSVLFLDSLIGYTFYEKLYSNSVCNY